MKQPKSELDLAFGVGGDKPAVTIFVRGCQQADQGEPGEYSDQAAIVARGATPNAAFRAAARRLRRLARDADRQATEWRGVPRGGFTQ